MLSSKSAAFISTCSVGVGILIGRRSCASDPKDLNSFGDSQAIYVFPTAQAKSLSPVDPDDNLPAVVDDDNKKYVDKVDDDNTIKSNVGEIAKYGIPSLENLRTFEDFILSYDKRNRTANWVLEHLTPQKVEKSNTDRSNMRFVEDFSFHTFHRATNKDFQGSGYDRGHLAAAGNHRHSSIAMSQTFLLSNVAPQVGVGFNRDTWNNLEKYTRGVARRSKNVHVCTGPLYLPRVEPDGKLYVKYEVIGSNHVAVPTHFFKVLLIENEKGDKELLSFVLPNQPLPQDMKLKHFLVPVETIERAAGLLIFERLARTTFKVINEMK